jgi:hypothetical protein
MQTILNWLKRALQFLLDKVQSFFQVIVDVIVGIVSWIWDTILWCFSAVFNFFFHSEDGVVWWFMDWLAGLMSSFLGECPDFSQSIEMYLNSSNTVMRLIGPLNLFFPIEETAYIFTVFSTFMIFYLIRKLLLKIIPTVG